MNTFLKWTALIATFLVLIVPFIVSENLFFPFIVGKALVFRTLVEVAFVAWVLLMLCDASYRPKLSPVLWSVIAFVGVLGLSTMFSENVWKSFWSNFERMEGYITILHLGAYVLVASAILNTEKLWGYFFKTALGSTVVMALYGIATILGPEFSGARLELSLGNAAYLAVYMLFGLALSVLLFFKSTRVWEKVVYGIAFVLQFVVLYYTGTRGTMLGLIGGALVSAVLIVLFDTEKIRRYGAEAALGIIALGVFGFIGIRDTSFVRESPILSRFASITLEVNSDQGRYFIWPMAIKGFAERPLLGWGQDNFNYIFNENYDPRMYVHEQWFDRAHNVVLDWVVAGGILGALSYIALFLAALFVLWRRTSHVLFIEKAIITGLFVAYTIHNVFVFDNLISYIFFFSFLAYIHTQGSRLSPHVAHDAEEISSNDTQLIGGIILVLLALVFYHVNYKPYATGVELINALRIVNTVNTAQGGLSADQARALLTSFEKALSYDGIGRSEVVERVLESAQVFGGAQVPLELRQQYVELANAALQKQLERAGDDARYALFAGQYYLSIGDIQNAETQYLRALELSPRKQTMMYALGNYYLVLNDFEKAIDIFKQAYELETKNDNAAEFYGTALIYGGKKNEARQFFTEAFGTPDVYTDVVIQAYTVLKNWDEAIRLLNKRVADNPTDATAWRTLVAVYVEIGNKPRAIEMTRKLIEADPSLKAQGEALIQQLSQ